MSAPTPTNGGWIRFQSPVPLGPAVARYLPRAGWVHRRIGADDALRTEESHRHQTPVLMTARLIRGTGPAAFEHLGSLPGEEPELTAVLHQGLSRTIEKLSCEEGLPARVAEFQLRFQTTATEELAAAMRTFFVERALPVMPDSRLLIVDMDQTLVSRYTLVRMLVSAENDPAVMTGPGFSAGRALATGGIYGADCLLAPALNILAPYVYAVPSARSRAAAAWIFGKSEPGAEWPSNQLIDSLKITSERFTGKRLRADQDRPTATGEQMAAFLTWWTGRVNELLAIATDPARFPDSGGSFYDPGRHWRYLASIERLFRDVGEAMQFTERGETARLRAAYDALDTLDGLRLGGFDACVDPASTGKALEYLRQNLPAGVAAVALPVCQRGLDALSGVRNGFLPGRYRGPNGLVGLPSKKGPVDRDWDKATSAYLRQDRNSAHSFMNFAPDERALVLAHDGSLPYGLANIAILWLLRVLADPNLTKSKMPIV